MTPIDFPGSNVVIAKNQPEYIPLPALRLGDGQLHFCWQLTWGERLKLLLTGRLWHTVLTFNTPLQPQMLSTDTPELVDINAEILRSIGRG